MTGVSLKTAPREPIFLALVLFIEPGNTKENRYVYKDVRQVQG